MPGANWASRIGWWPLEFLQFTPLLVFVYTGRLGLSLEDRFLFGAGAAILVVALLVVSRVRLNPLLVGVHAWLLLEAFSFVVYIPLLAGILQGLRESTLFLAITAVGAIYVLRSRSLLNATDDGAGAARTASYFLLGLAGLGVVAAFVFRGDEFKAAVIPAIVLFGAQAIADAVARRSAK